MDTVMEWYGQQTRFMVRFHEGRLCFLVHDTSIGCYWAATFGTYEDAVKAVYRHKHLPARR